VIVNGIGLALAASFSFSLMNALVKGASSALPAPEIAFFRGLFGFIVTALVMKSRGISFRGKNPRLLVMRGLFGGLSLLFTFSTLAHIPMADASLLAHLSPLFVVILGHFVLQEKLSAGFYQVFAVAMLGSLLVVKPGVDLFHSGWSLVGLIGAMIAAGASISIRRLSADHDTYLIMLYFMGAAAVVPLPFMESFVVPGPRECVLLLLLGSVSFVGQYFLTKAYAYKEAAVVALTRYAGILFNIALGFVFWAEVPDQWSLLGGVMILASCLWLGRKS